MFIDIANFYISCFCSARFLLSILALSFFTMVYSNKVIDVTSDFASGYGCGDACSSVMQLGELSINFEHEPIINKLPNKNDINANIKLLSDGHDIHNNISVFFLPQATISSKLYTHLQEICSKLQTPFLSFKLEKIKKPIAGLVFTVAFDVGRIEIEKRVQLSSLGKPGVHFNFYNKNLMQKLQSYDKGILKIS